MIGDDDRERAARSFRRVDALVRWHEGLFILVDHPGLLLSLHGRVPARQLFAAISPAAILAARRRARPGTDEARPASRNTHLAPPARLARPAEFDAELATGEAEQADFDVPKTPPPQAPCSALELIEAARACGVAIVAAPDVYYADPGGKQDHAVRAAIKHNALIHDLPAAWLARDPAHLPGFEELAPLYAEIPDVPGPWPVGGGGPGNAGPAALLRTRALAAHCDWRPPLDRVVFPKVELARDETPYSKLCSRAFDGARVRYAPLKPEVVRRLDYELSAIENLGFSPYFLLVDRLAEFARSRKIPCVGRGSAADSLVSYCLGLTDADPLRYRLPFERFLNPTRKDRPDIDLDFCWRRRDEVLAHVYEAFGAQRTAMICTLTTFGLRAAFREAALVHGLPPAEINRWSRRLPWHPAGQDEGTPFDGAGTGEEPDDESSAAPDGDTSARDDGALAPELQRNVLVRSLRSVPECREFPLHDPRWRTALAAGARLFGTPRHFGVHPGGVVVAPEDIADFVACQRARKGVVVTQLDKDAIEAIGLVKMDLLGNRALTVLDDATKALAERGIEVDLARLPEDDPRTAELLAQGRTLGCFQVESPGMRHLLQQIGSRNMDDVIQAVALIRPGPASSGMKDAFVRRFRGLEEPRAPHPSLSELLWDTQGVMLYQEDVMQVASALAGMDLAQADRLRRALQKNRGGELEELRGRFFSGARESGVEESDARHVWELISNFASFGFCKAHAVTYGRIAYRAVYLKAHHPAVYLAAFLASDTGYYERRVYVEEARRLCVPILGPDVNQSAAQSAIEWRAGTPCLRTGLGEVKGLGSATLERVLEARARGGPFLSLPAFVERTGAQRDECAQLVQCGAFDAFDRTRPELLWRLHLLFSPARRAPGGAALSMRELSACRATPASREQDALADARARTPGWSRSTLGLGGLSLARGQTVNLFAEPELGAPALPALRDQAPLERGLVEHAILGFALRAHPTVLFPCAGEKRLVDARAKAPPRQPCGRLAAFVHGRITLRGWLAASRRTRTSRGEWMRFLTLEDESGIAEVVVFPDVYARDGHLLVDQGPFLVSGVAEDQMGAVTLHAERIW
ncbi:MAG: DNA polymerase III subunit alpha [Planctomycetes bacterium]|nr:DNA polymerase III subunit alpha [Planctomycetota bacterium]